MLAGRIMRGVADRISAVLWFSDLRGYTTISDSASPDEIIPLLNDYADAVICSIHDAGGDVLKLIGDGRLRSSRRTIRPTRAPRALHAEAHLRGKLSELNERRAAEGRPVTSVYLGLHIGEVFYGNIGSDDRLDFTVVGPAVNEVSRIASICRSVDRHVVMSSEFASLRAARRISCRSAAMRCAASGARRNCSRSTPPCCDGPESRAPPMTWLTCIGVAVLPRAMSTAWSLPWRAV